MQSVDTSAGMQLNTPCCFSPEIFLRMHVVSVMIFAEEHSFGAEACDISVFWFGMCVFGTLEFSRPQG